MVRFRKRTNKDIGFGRLSLGFKASHCGAPADLPTRDDMVTKSATCCTNPVFVTFTLTYQNLLSVVGSFDKAQKSRFW